MALTLTRIQIQARLQNLDNLLFQAKHHSKRDKLRFGQQPIFYLPNQEDRKSMGININDLNDDLQPMGASLLSGNESVMDNLRELSDEELKASGGGKGDGFFFNGPSGTFFSGGGKKSGPAFFIQQPQPQVVQQPQFVQQPVVQQPQFVQQPVVGQPIGFPGGNIDIGVNPSSGLKTNSN